MSAARPGRSGRGGGLVACRAFSEFDRRVALTDAVLHFQTTSLKKMDGGADYMDTDSLKATELTLGRPQVVGWPPVRSYRKNTLKATAAAGGLFVKVSMDGAPYLRKIDLAAYRGYEELRKALEDMFKCFEGGKGSEYAITYEDKDGDQMLVGDVPWG
ncbi:hypothetical protein GW17_00000756 [Ensete ventricosum]|nr:hypothetical protein GW17_00000756 [Ensete ventricosum]